MDKGYPSSSETRTRASLTSAINSSILSRRIQRGHLDTPKLACHSAIHRSGTRVRPHVSESAPLVPSLSEKKERDRHNNATKMDARRWSKRLKIPLDQRIRNARSVGWMARNFCSEKERRELRSRVEEHLLLHLDYSPQKARMETVVI